jgi:hypothetical protein
VRLVKSGNSFTGYRSADGTSWIQVGNPVTAVMNSSIYVGLALSSHNNAQLNTSTFDNVMVSQLGAGAVVKSTKTTTTKKPAASAWTNLQADSARTDVYTIPMTRKA